MSKPASPAAPPPTAARPAAGSGGDVARPGGPSVGASRSAPAIDVQVLADKVYRLFLADLSLQRRRANGRKE
ncbi:hypothetical protein Dcar01_03726 [Deinococcus carri]|uniref:Uncharacterized protein n=1 Tax=Deinococcus carri TaxID=1211323 RepID=A0ABP9WCA8_9DEIO